MSRDRVFRKLSILAILLVLLAAGGLTTGPHLARATSPTSSGAFPSWYNSTSFVLANRTSINLSATSQANFLPITAPAWPQSANWYTYEWNGTGRTGYNPSESTVNQSNIKNLTQLWKNSDINGTITGSTILVNGTIYVGTYSGRLYAINATNGQDVWASKSVKLTAGLRNFTCNKYAIDRGGIYSTPTYWNNTLYVTAGSSFLYAINPSNGNIIWKSDVANGSTGVGGVSWYNTQLWSSPLVFGKYAYVGIASGCEGKAPIRGQLFQIPLSGSGSIHNASRVFNVTLGNTTLALGGGIWSTPAIDPSTVPKLVWITTGNCACTTGGNNAPFDNRYSESIVALNASNISQVIYDHNFSTSAPGDDDFGAGPTFFSDVNGNYLVGAINKNHHFYAVNRRSSASAWHTAVLANDSTGNSNSIAPATFDGHRLFIAADVHPCPVGMFNGTIGSYNTSTGRDGPLAGGWTNCTSIQGDIHAGSIPEGSVDLAGLTSADGMIFDAAGTFQTVCSGSSCSIPSYGYINYSSLEVRSGANGSLLYRHDFRQDVAGEVIVSDGQAIVAAGGYNNFSSTYGILANGSVYDFGLPLASNLHLVPTTISSGRWVVGGFGIPTGGMPGYSCEWYWGDGSSTSGCGTPLTPQTHSYVMTSATYTANLTVRDYRGAEIAVPFQVLVGQTATLTVTSNILLLNCMKSINETSYNATGGCTGGFLSHLYVSGFSSISGGSPPYTYSWTFGDGSGAILTQNAVHTYSNSNTYLVDMVGKDSLSHSAVAAVWITVRN